MSALAWGVGCAVAVVGLALVMARRRSLETHAARTERASRPTALRDAELVYMENHPISEGLPLSSVKWILLDPRGLAATDGS